jgi:D-xylose 1-dehydrogenase
MPEPPPTQYATYPSLSGRHAFVSGGASGLGAEFVSQLAAQGADVSFVDLDAERGEQLARDLSATGVTATFHRCDVTDIAAYQRVITAAADDLGPITVLINNAANDVRTPFAEVGVADWDDSMAVNVRHHFFAAQAVAPIMRDAGGGSIINLGSINARTEFPDLTSYVTAKAGIEGLTRAQAREYGPWDIRVNCLIPGWIMTEKQLTQRMSDGDEEMLLRRQKVKHKLYPADVARVMLFLAADDSRLCTGSLWSADGGWQ